MLETVTIPKAEYTRLLAAAEDLDDLRTYDAAMARLASGEDELIPAEFADRILNGESPLRVYRELRNLTGAELGRRAGLHRVQVHDIETGKKKGSVLTLKRLAEALSVTVDDLI